MSSASEILSRLEAVVSKYDPLIAQMVQTNRLLTQVLSLLYGQPPAPPGIPTLVTGGPGPLSPPQGGGVGVPPPPPTILNVSAVSLLSPSSVQEYSVTTSPSVNTSVELDFRGLVLWAIIDNTLSGGNDILISFNNADFKTLGKGEVLNFSPFSLPQSLKKIWHESSFASTKFEILTGEIP